VGILGKGHPWGRYNVSQFFQIHPDNPQARLIRQAVDIIRAGGVVVYPTDSAYALGCHIGDKQALDRIRRIRKLDDRHNFTLVCRDLSEIATYAKVDNKVYRMLRACTPGPYTFILKATSEVPRRLLHPKRKTVGLRVPANPITEALLDDLAEPLMSVTLIMPGDEYPLIDPYDIRQVLEHDVDLVIDGGYCGMEASTVVDLADDVPLVLRAGKGDTAPFED
jgi:tRNA threonylcarbamoyl adenosine modification protein (Sua5/YciO/YrdC/YwlC family)